MKFVDVGQLDSLISAPAAIKGESVFSAFWEVHNKTIHRPFYGCIFIQLNESSRCQFFLSYLNLSRRYRFLARADREREEQCLQMFLL